MNIKNRAAFAVLVGTGPGAVMSASELARRVDCSPSTIDQLRNGRMSRCRPELAEAIEQELALPGAIFHDAREQVLSS